MSGELLRVRMDLGRSIVTVVLRFATPSSASTWSSHSPSATRSFRLKRVGVGLCVAPRPWLDSTGMRGFYAAHENITRTISLLVAALRAGGRASRLAPVATEGSVREGRPAMLGHRLQGGGLLAVQPLVNPHVPKHCGDVVTGLPIRDRFDPQQRVALVVDACPSCDREGPG